MQSLQDRHVVVTGGTGAPVNRKDMAHCSLSEVINSGALIPVYGRA